MEKKSADIAELQLEGAARGAEAERRELVEGHEPRAVALGRDEMRAI